MLHSIIYISEAVGQFSVEQLSALLVKSRNNNLAANITGMLLYIQRADAEAGGRFMQVLEGEKETVQRVFDKIKQDDRHRNVLAVSEDDIFRREFETWSMGFRILKDEELELAPGYVNLNNESILDRKLSGISKPINYLRSFYQINRERRF